MSGNGTLSVLDQEFEEIIAQLPAEYVHLIFPFTILISV